MKRYGSIYIIKNKLNGMLYVGQTINSVNSRWKEHRKSKNNCFISKAIKNNVHNFEFIEFLTCFSKDDLNYWEKTLIKEFNSLAPNGYNLMTGGHESTFNVETRNRMSKIKLGKKSTNHIVPVYALNVKTNIMKKFTSLKEASTELNISRSSILKSCKYGIERKDHIFLYANQSGSLEENSRHAQRLESETENVNNLSTSPRFPKKYMDKKEEILNYTKCGLRPHAISRLLELDKSMVCYFVHCFGK